MVLGEIGVFGVVAQSVVEAVGIPERGNATILSQSMEEHIVWIMDQLDMKLNHAMKILVQVNLIIENEAMIMTKLFFLMIYFHIFI